MMAASDLIRYDSYVLCRSGKYVTEHCKWTTVYKKAMFFDDLKAAKAFLSGCRIKASIFANISVLSFRKIGSRSIVEYDSKFEKI